MTVLIERNAHRTRLFGERFQDSLPDPPYAVGDELHALLRIELLHRTQQSLIADGDQLGQIEAVTLILLDIGDDKPEVGRDDPLGRLLVTRLGESRQPTFFLAIFDEWEFLDVLQVLVKGARDAGPKESFGFARAELRHICPRRRFCSYMRVGTAVPGFDRLEVARNIEDPFLSVKKPGVFHITTCCLGVGSGFFPRGKVDRWLIFEAMSNKHLSRNSLRATGHVDCGVEAVLPLQLGT